ncbi:sporulation protein YqfC [Anaerosolibacter carboniphilus]|uniref:Sporulation protein YqfC n=1 Tax=Anaerosolibacter carboniphilus TaxID=1417629 RepID=A0A841L6L5_9FIRM|nr:sporulation protein YqfC [Anaerosolibacter carboniphilus]MBB6217925.1 sporulation protein YqfC [Anaerosolibacter carboniphilus]
MGDRTKEIKESISELLELPKDIILDLPRITMIGNLQIYIENHKGILEYSKQRIRIYTKNGTLRIIGRDLQIKTIITEEIIITGMIEQIEFV